MFNIICHSIVIIIFEANANTNVIYIIGEFFPVQTIRAIWDQSV